MYIKKININIKKKKNMKWSLWKNFIFQSTPLILIALSVAFFFSPVFCFI